MKKVYLYPVVGVVSALITVLICALALGQDVFTSILIAWLSAAACILVARGGWAVTNKEVNDSFVASEIWGVVAVGLYAWFIWNTSEAVQTSIVFGTIAAVINSVCFRFIAGKNEKICEMAEGTAPVVPMTRKEKISELAETIRYRFMPDGVTPNLDAPLCVDEDGRHLTPAEAEANGLGALYAEALEYIKSIVK